MGSIITIPDYVQGGCVSGETQDGPPKIQELCNSCFADIAYHPPVNVYSPSGNAEHSTMMCVTM